MCLRGVAAVIAVFREVVWGTLCWARWFAQLQAGWRVKRWLMHLGAGCVGYDYIETREALQCNQCPWTLLRPTLSRL